MTPLDLLVVQDQNAGVMVLDDKLQELGHRVVATATNAEEAVACAGRHHPSLAFMDVLLGGSPKGMLAGGIIRDRYRIPVILTAGVSDSALIEQAKLAGPFGYALKPFQGSELRLAIELAVHTHEIVSALENQERWLMSTLLSIQDAVIATNADCRITFMNPMAEQLTGWAAPSALGLPVSRVFQALDESRPFEGPTSVVSRVFREGRAVQHESNMVLLTAGGQRIPIEDQANFVRDVQGKVTGTVLVFRDITDRKLAEAEMWKLASTDPLTGLYNRRFLLRRLSEETARLRRSGTRSCIVMIDLDKFKKINDAHGHEMGDAVLFRIAEVIRQRLRTTDVAGRYGGDELCILLSEVTLEAARSVIESLVEGIAAETFRAGPGFRLKVTLSAGIAPLDGTVSSFERAMKLADEALYQAKAEGGDRIVVHQPHAATLPLDPTMTRASSQE
jgi:diguanylate cyclase (GGDEF)-like protein/PAS domain S-box-containing protein